MRPTFRMAGALVYIGQAGVGQPQQRSGSLLNQIDLNETLAVFRRGLSHAVVLRDE